MDKAQVLDDAAIRKALGHSDYYAVDFEDVLTAQRDADDTYYQQRITELETALERWQMLRPVVQAFALEMERQLRENDHKGGWKDCYPWPLIDRAREELDELQQAVDAWSEDEFEHPSVRCIEEAADAANFPLMVADICGKLDVDTAAAALRGAPAKGAS